MFQIRQWGKMFLQNVLLPIIYNLYRRKPVEKGLVLFADGHHEEMPFSMRRMYETVQEKEQDGLCRIELFVTDFDELSWFRMAGFLWRFMHQYALAEYVFICDYFLPISSCRKRPETKVVQLWHSCGLMKKIAYDAKDDIPAGYHGNMFGNYTYLTMSAKACISVHERALRISADHIFATGISRTDYYFDKHWNRKNRLRFYRQHPEASGKKIAVWAPTFRGNAGEPRMEGLAAIQRVREQLEDEWFLVIKAHPLIDAHEQISTCSIPTEDLFTVADVLITDYSSVLFDYLLYRKPVVLFAPDLDQYESTRGFYIDYRSLPFPLAETEDELTEALATSSDWMTTHEEEIEAFGKKYVGACDGHSTERILKLIGMSRERSNK